MEYPGQGSAGGSLTLLVLPLPAGHVVVWSAAATSRAFDQFASGLGH